MFVIVWSIINNVNLFLRKYLNNTALRGIMWFLNALMIAFQGMISSSFVLAFHYGVLIFGIGIKIKFLRCIGFSFWPLPKCVIADKVLYRCLKLAQP